MKGDTRRGVLYGVAIAAASLIAVFWALPDVHRLFFVWDHNFGPAVSYACGHPLAEITQPVPGLVDFLNRRRDDFDCSLVPGNVQLGPLNAYANGIPYFLKGLGFYWRMIGVSWANLAPLFGILYAISNVLVFLLFKQFLGNGLGFLCSLAYVFSPSNYYSLTYYEHYAKVPIFVASVLIMVWLSRRPTVSRRQLLGAAAGGGLLLGVGFGIRADLWLLTIPFAAALLFFSGVDRRPSWTWRCLACVVFLGVGITTALPSFLSNGRSYFWLQVVEGLATDFDPDLSVRPAMYEWVPRYSDELGASWMQDHAFHQVHGGIPAPVDDVTGRATPAPRTLDWQMQETGGMAGYLAILEHFPADFVTRPLAAVLKVIVESFKTQRADAALFQGSSPNFFTRTVPIWSLLEPFGVWLVLTLAATLVVTAVRNPRQALFYLLLVLYIGGMTAIVFLSRHRWHLYFIGFLIVGLVVKFVRDHAGGILQTARSPSSVVPLAERLLDEGRVGAGALRALLIVVALAGAVILAGRSYQDHVVGQLVERLLASDKEPIRIERQRLDETTQLIVAPGLVDRFDAYAVEADRFQYGDYLVATFSRDACHEPMVKLVYKASQASFDHSRSIALDFSRGSRSFSLVFPAYGVKSGESYGYFEGIEVAAGSEACLTALSRFRDPASLPFLITWRIPEHWEGASRHQTLVFPPEEARR